MTNGDTTRGPAEEPSASVHVTSFTYAHGPVPVADITLDLRRFGDSLDLEPGDLTGIPVCDTCSPPAAGGGRSSGADRGDRPLGTCAPERAG